MEAVELLESILKSNGELLNLVKQLMARLDKIESMRAESVEIGSFSGQITADSVVVEGDADTIINQSETVSIEGDVEAVTSSGGPINIEGSVDEVSGGDINIEGDADEVSGGDVTIEGDVEEVNS